MARIETNWRSDADALRELILGMRAAYMRGENAMAFARALTGSDTNSIVSALIAYDLQAGNYIKEARNKPEYYDGWTRQLAAVLGPLIGAESSILEVGCGEATTLAGVVAALPATPADVLGFDISWSRVAAGQHWCAEKQVAARLFVADLFEIPLADGAIDVVYTSHSIEPNGGREEEAVSELLRVAAHAVVLVEPIYELASSAAQQRMASHGYVRGLRSVAERLGATVTDYRLLQHTGNPLNPSGVIVLRKADVVHNEATDARIGWRCPLTHVPLREEPDAFIAEAAGLVYPVLRSIPMLRAPHAIVASKIVKR